MAASGNSIALKSFQSFTINEGLLAKVVEAVKSGEKEARTSGNVKSFEVFYKGFRQNISIGRIYIVPSKVCDVRNTFPVALLFGTVVKTLNLGEEVADLITNKIGDTEFDEYSQADYTTIKETLFTGDDGKVTSLVIFAPNWSNIREYVGFKFVSDDDKLSNLLRHLVFSAYFNPAVSSAFDALMTTVDTRKLDITDITPKLTYPFLSDNPLRAYPELVKQGGWVKEKVFLTKKTADAITKEVLDPQELNVFEALDTALTEATLPDTESMDEVADFKGPSGSNEGNAEVPQIEGIENTKSDEGFRDFIQKGKEAGTHDPKTTHQAKNKEATTDKTAKFDYAATNCPDCGAEVDAFKMCPNVSDAHMGMQFCGKGQNAILNKGVNLWSAPQKSVEREPEPLRNRQIGSAQAKNAKFDHSAVQCPDCGTEVDAFKMCPNLSAADANRGLQFCGKGMVTDRFWAPKKNVERETPSIQRNLFGSANKTAGNYGVVKDYAAANQVYDSRKDWESLPSVPCQGGDLAGFDGPCDSKFRQECEGQTECRDCHSAKGTGFYDKNGQRIASAPFETPFTNVGPGTSAHEHAEKGIAVKVDTVSQKGDPKVNSPIGIAIDETGVPRRAEEERKAASEHIASEIMRDLDTGYTAMSSKTKAANQKREDELNKRYAGRQKNADVPLTEESIWGDIMEDFGEAPQVKLPGESKGKSETKTDKGESAPVEKSVESVEKSESKPESKGPKSKLFQNKNKPKEEPKKEAPKEEKQAAAKKADEDIHPAKYDAIKMSPRIRDLSVPDKHKLRIALDTVKNPNKALLGGPSVEEAQETIYKLTGRRVATVKVAEELGGDFTECPDCKSKGTSFTAPRGAGNSQYKCKTCNDTGRIFKPTKKADCVRPDIAEARSKVVSPNTVDKDIKQPTKSVEEAAKVASFPVKYADMEWYSRVVDAFGDPRKAHQWMTTPSKEFGGKTPIKALEENNMDSSILEPFLTRMEHGVDYDPGKVGGAIDWVKDKLVQNKPKLSPEEQKVFNALYSREMNQARSEYMGEVNQQIDEDGRQGRVWTEMYKRFPHLSKGASGISEKKTVKVNCPECGNKSGFRTKAGELKCFGCSHSWSDKTACEEIDSMCGDKVSSDVSGDISEAKSKVVSPDTVDRDIKQPTKSVEEAAKVAAWVTYDDLTSAGTATLGRITRTMPDLIKKYGEDAVLEGVYEATSQLGHLEEIGSSDVSFWVRQVIKDLERNPNQRNLDEEHTASAGDENDESVEMELGFGDLADLGANMPRQAITAEMHAPIPSGTLAKRVKELNAEGLYSAAAIAKKLNVSVDRVKAVIEGSK